ncbi:CarR_dom_SF, lycopene cyclase domain [Candidatus Nanopelagicaceae bacterium]
MTYTAIAITAVFVALTTDYFIARTRLILTKRFWTSYAIIIFFQLITNWWLTSRNIVMYSPDAIMGIRIASAPAEDLLFGFALVTLVLILWDKPDK